MKIRHPPIASAASCAIAARSSAVAFAVGAALAHDENAKCGMRDCVATSTSYSLPSSDRDNPGNSPSSGATLLS